MHYFVNVNSYKILENAIKILKNKNYLCDEFMGYLEVYVPLEKEKEFREILEKIQNS